MVNINCKAVARASGSGFPGSQARPKLWSGRDFGQAMHITKMTMITAPNLQMHTHRAYNTGDYSRESVPLLC